MDPRLVNRQRLAPAQSYVLSGVRAWAGGGPVPAPPLDDAWIPVAAEHRVLALLASAFYRQGIQAPDDVRSNRLSQAVSDVRSLSELGWLADVLDAGSVPWAVVKGPALSYGTYREAGIRQYGDLDVLVAPRDFGRAVALLEDAGAGLVDQNWPMMRERVQGELSLRLPAGTPLDLHWHLVNRVNRRSQFPGVRSTDLLAARRSVKLQQRVVQVLDPLDATLHVALHGCLSGAIRLLWLVDLQQCLHTEGVDAAALMRRAEQWGAVDVMRVMVDRARRFVDPRLPALGRDGWTTFADAVSRVCPPGVHLQRGFSGRAVFEATRGTGGASWRQLATTARAAVVHRRAASHGDDEPAIGRNPLHERAGTPADRAAYFETVAGQPG